MTPLSRSARTRLRQVDGATPTAAARALFGIRASAARWARMRRSTWSRTGRTLFDRPVVRATGVELLAAMTAIYRMIVKHMAGWNHFVHYRQVGPARSPNVCGGIPHEGR